MKKWIELITQTHRGNNNHQALVCVICDRLIIGTERIHSLTKERILENQIRLSVKTYEEFYDGQTLNQILVQQYFIHSLPGLLLSPRSYQEGNNFEACSSCYSSLMTSKAKAVKRICPIMQLLMYL